MPAGVADPTVAWLCCSAAAFVIMVTTMTNVFQTLAVVTSLASQFDA